MTEIIDHLEDSSSHVTHEFSRYQTWVHEGRDSTRAGQRVAIKTCGDQETLEDEIQVMEWISRAGLCPHVVSLLEVSPDRDFFVMEAHIFIFDL